MHSNSAFRRISRDRNLRFAAQRGFGVLAINGAGPLVSHIPFILAENGAAVHAHLVRGNPIARHLREKECAAVLAVSGPDSYVSPDWYGADTVDQVPTWNYVAVHIRARSGAARMRRSAPTWTRCRPGSRTSFGPSPRGRRPRYHQTSLPH